MRFALSSLLPGLLLVACGSRTPEADPETPAPPAVEEPGCTVGADQTCNENPAVSSLWGRCTERGTCECKPGFEVGPRGQCRPVESAP